MLQSLIMLLSLVFVVSVLPLSATAISPFDVFEASTLNQVVKRNKLIVGMEVEFFPFEYANEKGEPIGFDVELAKLAAKELGVQIEIKDMEFSGLIPALQGGKVDMIISGMTRTLTRAKTVSFTQPYFVTGLCALLSKQKAPNVQSVEELNAPERIIAVKLGTTGDSSRPGSFPRLRSISSRTKPPAGSTRTASMRGSGHVLKAISDIGSDRKAPVTILLFGEEALGRSCGAPIWPHSGSGSSSTSGCAP